MTNVEYLEMIEREGYGCTSEDKNSKYMKSIARSLAVIADSLDPREKVEESYYIKSCSNCKYYDLFGSEEPCCSCIASSDATSNCKCWEPKEGKE